MFKNHKPLLCSLGATLLLAFSSVSAQALTTHPSGTSCNLSSVSGAAQCAGVFAGNNSNQELDGLFGVQDWGTEYKIDASSGSMTFAGTTLSIPSTDQDWSLSSIGQYQSLMFVLKGGPSFSAFLMNTTILSGTWDVQSMLNGNGKRGAGLSHWSVYVSGTPPFVIEEPSNVPLPAAGLLMLTGLGALAAWRARKRNS